MATGVRASCPGCEATIEMPGAAFTVSLSQGLKEGTYSFTCPECGEACVKPAPRDVVNLFKMAVGVTWVYPPAELDERHDGPMLTHDDLITFAVALWSADDAEILARAVL